MSVDSPLTKLPALRPVPIFRGLNKATLFEVARKSSDVAYPAGTTVVRQGDPGDSLCVVAKGELDVYQDERLIRRLKAGDFFGEISLIDGDVRTTTVVAVGNVELIQFSSADFEELISVPYVARMVMRNLAELLREAESARGQSDEGASEAPE